MTLTHGLLTGLVLTCAACGDRAGTDARDERGPLPSAERKGPGEVVRTFPTRPRADEESELGANDRDPGASTACQVLVDPYSSPPVPVHELVAVVVGTKDHPEIRGEVRFVGTNDGARLQSRVTGLPSGPHAHHVHLFGDCSDPAVTAGPPFDFRRPLVVGTAGGTPARIPGDLGDLQGTKGAETASDETIPGLRLTGGPDTLIGRAVVIHAGPNDPSQPSDSAGAPIACGVIGIVGTASARPGGPPPLERPPGTTQAAPSPTPGQAADDTPGQIRTPPAPAPPAPAPVPVPGPSGR